jgi:hypothetical protein
VGTQDVGNADHNGRGTISNLSAKVNAPPTPSAQDVGCGGSGNTKWTVTLNTLTATRRASRDQAGWIDDLLSQLHARRTGDRHRLLTT